MIKKNAMIEWKYNYDDGYAIRIELNFGLK